eukprot:2987078-Alexandrium_andersonii.AAC.1
MAMRFPNRLTVEASLFTNSELEGLSKLGLANMAPEGLSKLGLATMAPTTSREGPSVQYRHSQWPGSRQESALSQNGHTHVHTYTRTR